MKILQLCKKIPYPLKDGESIAVTYMSKALHDAGCEVTLLSMNTSKHYTQLSEITEGFDHYKNVHVTDLNNDLNPIDAFVNLFSKDSYHVSRFVCDKFESKLKEILSTEDFDIVQLETFYLTPYIPVIKKYSKAIVSLRAHNIEHEIWERITSNTSSPVKKWYLNHLTNKLRNYERNHVNEYDYIITVSDRDLKRFKGIGYTNGAMATPIGLNLKDYIEVNPKTDNNGICFIGALDWMPNIEGLQWFLKNVWPILQKSNAGLKFHIAGRNTPDSIMKLASKNIVVHGEVPNAQLFMSRFPVMVVPLFSGSGTRVKILEGLALERGIVTTSIGLEGINARHEKEILIADDPTTFAQSINKLLSSDKLLTDMGKKGKAFVINHYDNKDAAEKLIDKYQKLMASPAYKS